MIKLDDNWSIKPDSEQWVLNYKKEMIVDGKDKPKVSKSHWYCSSLENALKRYLNECAKPSENVMDCYRAIKKAESNIRTMLLEVKI